MSKLAFEVGDIVRIMPHFNDMYPAKYTKALVIDYDFGGCAPIAWVPRHKTITTSPRFLAMYKSRNGVFALDTQIIKVGQKAKLEVGDKVCCLVYRKYDLPPDNLLTIYRIEGEYCYCLYNNRTINIEQKVLIRPEELENNNNLKLTSKNVVLE